MEAALAQYSQVSHPKMKQSERILNADECDAAEHLTIAALREMKKQGQNDDADNSMWDTKIRKPKLGPLNISRQAPDFQGYLERQSSRPSTGLKRRWVELRCGLLTWFSDVNGKPKGAISLEMNCTLRDDPECMLGFIILQPGHPPMPYFFKAYSLDEKEAWMRHILGAISSPFEVADQKFGESGDEMSLAEIVFDKQFDRQHSDPASPSEVQGGCQTVPQAPKRKKTCLSDFELLSVIGRGTYGKVLKVRRKDTGTIHAMKVMSKEVLIRSNMVDYTRKEKIIMANVNHPFLVNLTWAFQTKEKVYLVMDFLQGGELYVHLRRKGRFREPRAKFYAAQVVLAFEYLHTRNVIFRDLKPENVVLGKDGYACLTDFGMARTFDGEGGEDRTNSFCGTDAYLSPEMVRGEHYHCENDWWSLGVLLFEMLQGDVPFYNDNVSVLYEQILSAPLMFHKSVSPAARDLLCALLCRDKSERLTSAEDIKRHEFFQDIHWDRLLQKELTPPFVPDVADDDTKYFDEKFTAENPVLSVCPPVDPSLNLQFVGFSYHGRGSPEGP
eukprot:EG_transcript_5056